MTLRLVSDDPHPKHRFFSRSLMSPDQHRRQAELLRKNGSPKALELAYHHDVLARAIEQRAVFDMGAWN